MPPINIWPLRDNTTSSDLSISILSPYKVDDVNMLANSGLTTQMDTGHSFI